MKIIIALMLVFAALNVNAKGHLFFLHNRYLEEAGLEGVHPEYGKVEYNEIISTFTKAGFEVHSELRAKGTDEKVYAKKIAKEIMELLDKGVKPSEITVVGTSKGGYIAKSVSNELKNKYIKYVLIGCCSKDDDQSLTIYGNILSIYEQSDDIGGSCLQNKQQYSKVNIPKSKEIMLQTGLKHGFLYKALKEWLNPTIYWAKLRQ